MKIIDTFLFYNEFDLLELRLTEHYDHVDEFVILEFDRTFTGISKPYILEDQLDRYKQWRDKITYIKVSGGPDVDLSNPKSVWDNEFWQFNQMSRGWKNVQDDDVVLICCVDEMFRPEFFEYIRNTDYGHYVPKLPIFYCKFNMLGLQEYKSWAIGHRGFTSTPRELRDMDYIPGKTKTVLEHAGWHFSYMGDEEWIKNKLKSFSHVEVNQPHIIDNISIDNFINSGVDFFQRGDFKWIPVDLDLYFPKSILENKEKYAKFILPDSGNKVQNIIR
jgi:hypothetical protein